MILKAYKYRLVPNQILIYGKEKIKQISAKQSRN